MPTQRELARTAAAALIKSVEWPALGALRKALGATRDGTLDEDARRDLQCLVDGLDQAWRALERMKLRRDASAARSSG